ncbi:MAG: nucleoside triphosphate pyrophosphohydrolase [Patescibacteria group bacterium]|jgi:predicted house-cleaning noncanonical NTP pyrophosphatase (MazG superfamily)
MHSDERHSNKSQNTPTGDIYQHQAKRSRGRPLNPLRSVTVITAETGSVDFSAEEITAEHIGHKAYGLASLPSGWVPSFFVLSSSCFEGECTDQKINAWAEECLARIGISADRQVKVRSSGTSETMRNRGRIESRHCLPHQLVATIRDLISELPQIPGGKVHWIVQEYINPKERGHLSNERQLKKEKRDWVAEFEPLGHRPGYLVSIAVRRWRDGTSTTDLDLNGSSEFEITLRLKSVAIWASELHSRIHFEWVWDGKTVWIVQADTAEQATGIDPSSLLQTQIQCVELAYLKAFRVANRQDYERYGKLRNVKLYEELGYNMPIFYIIDNKAVVGDVLSGQIPSRLESDLIELTRRSLIIRTEGTRIPEGKREMLPRSEELRSYAEVRDWLLNSFTNQIKHSGLENGDLCLIAHHFIPSVASAWARAEPGNRIVRIESLWGIPEGLYWYSHDTFEVDTKTVDVDFGPLATPLKYKYFKRLRFKSTFIAPDENGKWLPNKTMPPFDWRKSISKENWLFEIARTTRQVAEREKYAVSLMWFIDNHPQATKHAILPWLHSKSELTGSPKAAPRQKRKSASDFSIKSVADWQRLKDYPDSEKHIERVVVEPVDPELIRNHQFAEDLAGLAASKKFVVELSGGILSHAYYILQRQGAQVECIDLFGADEDIVEYNKVVRDKIPVIIEERGEYVKTKKLEGNALVLALRQKLIEEAFEVLDVKSGQEMIGELADVQEVVRALCHVLRVSTDEIETEREQKVKRRGGFDKGLMLVKTATPHSIQKLSVTPDSSTMLLKQEPSEPVISDVADLPTKLLYHRPDLRQISQDIEKMFTFEIEVNKIGKIKQTLDFSIPLDDQRHQSFTLTVELTRIRSSVRGVVRLRPQPLQLEMEFVK